MFNFSFDAPQLSIETQEAFSSLITYLSKQGDQVDITVSSESILLVVHDEKATIITLYPEIIHISNLELDDHKNGDYFEFDYLPQTTEVSRLDYNWHDIISSVKVFLDN